MLAARERKYTATLSGSRNEAGNVAPIIGATPTAEEENAGKVGEVGEMGGGTAAMKVEVDDDAAGV